MVFNITVSENRPRLVKKFSSLRYKQDVDRDQVNTMEGRDTLATASTQSSSGKRVNNMSSVVFDEKQLDILSKGPNLALTQNVTKNILLEVEKSVERLAYAKRWIDDIQRQKQSGGSNIAASTEEPAGERPRQPALAGRPELHS